MRSVRFKSKIFWFTCACLFCVVVLFMKRYTMKELYRDTVSDIWTYGEFDESRKSFPRLRIVRKIIGETNLTSNFTKTSSTELYQQACRFPELRVDDPDIRHLFHRVAPLTCAREKNWIYVRNGTFFVDSDAIRRHGDGADGERTKITCDLMQFWRESEFKTASKWFRNFENGTKLAGDFFKVDCRSSKDGAKYSNFHAAVAPLPNVVKRCRSTILPERALGLNVYMLGFDSLSRMTFMRKLPKTYEYLTRVMHGIVLNGYNIVGDGTPQALIPILTGKSEVELPMTRKRFRNAQYVNVYPFIWNEFRDAGYATLYGEDAAAIGTFTYRLKGFDAQPTDHYMRTFYTLAEKRTSQHGKYCWGSEAHHKVHFGYVEHFWESYPLDIRKFAFQFHSVMSHDDINQIGVADDDMLEHLRLFVERGYTNDTIVIFMSDHGHRFASLRETQQGKLEERLPFFAFAFPPWFADKYPESVKAFKTNADRLTTPFDIHATFKSMLDFKRPQKANLENRGLSLFDVIPAERSCANAGIEAHWCSCLDWMQISITDPLIRYMAASLVRAINDETERERGSCARLKLDSIVKASHYVPSLAVLRYHGARDKDGFVPDLTANTPVRMEYFQINLRTVPGYAHYEASIAWDKRSNEIAVDLDAVSHVNKYGDLPHCVIDRDYFLAKWCVCFDKVKSSVHE